MDRRTVRTFLTPSRGACGRSLRSRPRRPCWQVGPRPVLVRAPSSDSAQVVAKCDRNGGVDGAQDTSGAHDVPRRRSPLLRGPALSAVMALLLSCLSVSSRL